LSLIDSDLPQLAALIDPSTADGDSGKFKIAQKVVRAIHHFDGWYVPTSLSWFDGGFDQPL